MKDNYSPTVYGVGFLGLGKYKCKFDNQLINDPNFKASGNWGEGSWYERNNKMHYELFLEKAKYILEKLEDLKHLIIDEDEL